VSASFEDLGGRQMKNIADPVHAYRIFAAGLRASSSIGAHAAPLSQNNSPHPGAHGIFDRGGKASLRWAPSITQWATVLFLAAILLAALAYAWLRGPTLDAGTSKGKSIAVLPFVDISDKRDQEYFSDGLSEELIDRLTHVGDLKVIARTSSFQFKGKNEDIRVIAEKLGVTHLLEGSVRKHDNQLRITAQLIEARGGTHLWSQTYDRSSIDIFDVQDEIARNVSQALRVALNSGRVKEEAHPSDVRTYNLLLEGHYFENHSNKEDLEKAIRLYKEAIQLDPVMRWPGSVSRPRTPAWVNSSDRWKTSPKRVRPSTKPFESIRSSRTRMLPEQPC
jgi:TolB-like protein